jgi:hypothetical protein
MNEQQVDESQARRKPELSEKARSVFKSKKRTKKKVQV